MKKVHPFRPGLKIVDVIADRVKRRRVWDGLRPATIDLVVANNRTRDMAAGLGINGGCGERIIQLLITRELFAPQFTSAITIFTLRAAGSVVRKLRLVETVAVF